MRVHDYNAAIVPHDEQLHHHDLIVTVAWTHASGTQEHAVVHIAKLTPTQHIARGNGGGGLYLELADGGALALTWVPDSMRPPMPRNTAPCPRAMLPSMQCDLELPDSGVGAPAGSLQLSESVTAQWGK